MYGTKVPRNYASLFARKEVRKYSSVLARNVPRNYASLYARKIARK